MLLGDAAHLITPMWALGLNTGILDANNLAWRVAWVLRGWADDSLFDGFEREQKPVAERGSGEMAEAARAYMQQRSNDVKAMSRARLGQRLYALAARRPARSRRQRQLVDGEGIRLAAAGRDRRPRAGRRGAGQPGPSVRLHDLFGRSFVALYFTDARRRPDIPENDHPWLAHYVVSRWDPAAHIRQSATARCSMSGNAITQRYGCPPDTMVLVRPDDHIAAIAPMSPGVAEAAYRAALEATQREAVPA